tara:strand:+ start:13246 stop:13782 length:537 start_codon:yes stop_codon:yes gene_type:complete
MEKVKLLDKDDINSIVKRLSFEILDKNKMIDNLAIVGIRTRGEVLANRIHKFILDEKNINLKLGILDVTFYRDDFRTNLGSPKIGPSNITFDVNNITVVLVDDVLYTGRTIRAAMDEIFSFGRPKRIQLCTLVDRGHRELPIKSDYVGKNYPTKLNEHVYVHLKEIDGSDEIFLKEYK